MINTDKLLCLIALSLTSINPRRQIRKTRPQYQQSTELHNYGCETEQH